MPALDLKALWIGWLVAFIAAAVLFGAFPGIDLAVSGLFHAGDAGFWLESAGIVTRLRYLLWNTTTALVAVSALGLVLALILRRPALWLPARIWGFIFLLYLIGPGLIVNGILKSHWGRARPYQTVEFGGTLAFTPFYEVSDACARNCSFVSGEGASSMALGISALVILLWFRRGLGRRLPVAVAVALAIPVIGGALRLIVGRHFLSDTVFAQLIVLGVALALYGLLLQPGKRRVAGRLAQWRDRWRDRWRDPRHGRDRGGAGTPPKRLISVA